MNARLSADEIRQIHQEELAAASFERDSNYDRIFRQAAEADAEIVALRGERDHCKTLIVREIAKLRGLLKDFPQAEALLRQRLVSLAVFLEQRLARGGQK